MKTRKIISVLLLLSLIGFGIGYYILKIYNCEASIFCYFLSIKGEALYYGMGALSVVFLILFIFPKSNNSWKRFAWWFIPMAILLFTTYKGSGYFSWDPEQVFRWVSGLYVLVSLIIIAQSAIRGRIQKS